MATFSATSVALLLLSLLVAGVIVGDAQNCGCASGLCCSKFGYCGTTAAYCGDGCRGGPCYSSSTPSNGGSVGGIVTQAFFDGITSQAGGGCEGNGFYTRNVFISATGKYPAFGTTGSSDDSKREIAAFFAHVTQETGHFCSINEINGPSKNYCDPKNTQYPCLSSNGYYGRGPLQISWNYNYGPCGDALGFDGLRAPETLANNNLISFQSALWFWMNNCHSVITSGQGFGATIRAINSIECNGGNSAAVNNRVQYYTQYCQQLGVAPGDNLTC